VIIAEKSMRAFLERPIGFAPINANPLGEERLG